MNQYAGVAGWLSLVFGFITLFFYIVVPAKTGLISTFVIVTLVNGLFFLVADWKRIRTSMSRRSTVYGMNATVLVLVVMGLLVFLNLISARHKVRWDLTEGGLFSLSDQTKKIVSQLPREVKVTAFFQTEDGERQRFKNMVDGYLEQSSSIDLKFIDPDKNPAVTKRYGVTTYRTVVLESGKQVTKVSNATEENLTNGILKVINDEQKTIYFLDGHGEKPLDGLDKESYSVVKKSLEQDNFLVKPLMLMQTGEIPEDASVVVIAGATKPVTEKEQGLLKSYLDKGGSVFILTDPQVDVGMQPFLQSWGIILKNDMVIDPLSRLFGGDFAAPIVNEYTFHDITKDFGLATIFPLVRSVTVQAAPGVETVELLKTGDNSWGETDFNTQKVKFDEGTDLKGPVPVMVIASKSSGPPQPQQETQGAEGEDANNPPPADSKSKANLVVIGDSDFASNQYFNFSGNGDFFLNTLSWLAAEDTLISIRAKERDQDPIQLTRTSGNLIFILGIIVFPGAVIVAGIRVWWRRRSQ